MRAAPFLPLLLATAIVPAAEVELTPFVGLRGGGELDGTGFTGADLDASPSFGLTLDVALAPEKWISGLFSHQSTEATLSGLGSGDERFELDLDYLHVAGAYRPSRTKGAEPFILFGAGVTLAAPRTSGFDRDQALSLVVGGGGRFPLGERLAFRLEGRGWVSFGSMSFRGICGGAGCTVQLSGDGAAQFEALAGLSVRLD